MFRIARHLLIAGAVLWGLPRPVAAAGGEATFGSQWWDQSHPDAKYQEFREVPRGAFLESFVLSDWSGGSAFWLQGANVIRSDQSASLGWLQGARLRLDVGYSQIPHTFSHTARTPYAEIRPGFYVLPDTLQRTNQDNPGAYGTTMVDLLQNSPRVPLGFRTDLSTARLKVRPVAGWQFQVQATRRNRTGNKPWGAPFGFNSAIELPEPIQQRVTDADASASYQRNRVTVQASVGVSGFDNKVSTLFWDNPKRLTDRTSATAYTAGDGGAAGRTDLYPDNEVVRGNLALGIQLPRHSALTATVGVSRYTQDDDWLPLTVNSAIPQSSLDSLPGRSTDGEALRLTGDYRLTTRPNNRFSATLRLRHDRYENDTPEHAFSGRVRMDQTFIAGPSTTHPASYEQLTWGLDADLQVVRQLKLGGVLEQRNRERTHREVEEDDETVLGVRARLRPGMGIELSGDYRRRDRELDQFHLDEYRKSQDPDSILLEQPDLRRFDLADRKQDWARAGVSVPLGDRVLFYAGYQFLHNDYGGTLLGLRDEERHNVSAEASVALSDRLELSGGFGWEKFDTDQQSRESGGTLSSSDTTNWTALIDDKSTYAFVNANWWAIADRLSLGASYELSEAQGEYDLGNFKNTAVDLPDTKFRRHDLMVQARWLWMTSTDLAVRYGFEQYDVTDFASEDVPLVFPVVGASNAIFLGDSSIDYRAHRVALVATRRF